MYFCQRGSPPLQSVAAETTVGRNGSSDIDLNNVYDDVQDYVENPRNSHPPLTSGIGPLDHPSWVQCDSLKSSPPQTNILILKNIAKGATAMNERSSRSHSVVSIHVRGADKKSGSSLQGNLHLIDLAGSERVDRSEVTGDRLKEAQYINKSLSALGDVIFPFLKRVPMYHTETTSLLNFCKHHLVASLKDTILTKDEEIERLQLLEDLKNVQPNVNSEKLETATD